MKLVGLVYSIEELDNLKDKLDCVMIEVNGLSNPKFSNYDSFAMINKVNEYNLIPILKINKMVHPNEIDYVKITVVKKFHIKNVKNKTTMSKKLHLDIEILKGGK